MRIGLDYDNTYTLHPAFWNAFLVLARANGHEVRVVTARSPVLDRTAKLVELEEKVPVIYCNGISKEYHCTYWTSGWFPDFWVDDKTINIHNNSSTPADKLTEWRMTRGEGPSYPLGDALHPIGLGGTYAGMTVSPGHIVTRHPDGGLEVCPVEAAFRPHMEDDHEVKRMIDEGGPAHGE